MGRYNLVPKLPNGMTSASGKASLTAFETRSTMRLRTSCSISVGEI